MLLDIETLDIAPIGGSRTTDSVAYIREYVDARMVNIKLTVPRAIDRSLMYKLLSRVRYLGAWILGGEHQS